MIYIRKNRKGEYYFRITGKNNEKLCHGQGITNKANVKKSLTALYGEITNLFLPDGNFNLKFNDSNIKDQTNGK